MKEYDVQKFILGLVFIILSVKILKRTLRLPRPFMDKDSTFGMPSTRAASLFFIMIFLLLVHKLTTKTITLLIGGVALCCAIKYFMKEHSLGQLAVGAAIGTVVAYIVYLL